MIVQYSVVFISALLIPIWAKYKDPLIFVSNPVEAGFPGHWLPLSIVKVMVERQNDVDKITTTTKNTWKPVHSPLPDVTSSVSNTDIHHTPIHQKESTIQTVFPTTTESVTLSSTAISTNSDYPVTGSNHTSDITDKLTTGDPSHTSSAITSESTTDVSSNTFTSTAITSEPTKVSVISSATLPDDYPNSEYMQYGKLKNKNQSVDTIDEHKSSTNPQVTIPVGVLTTNNKGPQNSDEYYNNAPISISTQNNSLNNTTTNVTVTQITSPMNIVTQTSETFKSTFEFVTDSQKVTSKNDDDEGNGSSNATTSTQIGKNNDVVTNIAITDPANSTTAETKETVVESVRAGTESQDQAVQEKLQWFQTTSNPKLRQFAGYYDYNDYYGSGRKWKSRFVFRGPNAQNSAYSFGSPAEIVTDYINGKEDATFANQNSAIS